MSFLNNFPMHLFKYRLINETVKLNGVLLILKRFKGKKDLIYKKKGPCQDALDHFDDFYKAVFGEKWPSVRLGLLSKPKTFALINNFGDPEETEKYLKSQGAVDLKSFLEVQKGFVLHLKDEALRLGENVINLDEVVSQQLLTEKERESVLHPEGSEFQARIDSFNEDNEGKEEEKYIYDPADAGTSLENDLRRSEIDTTRLILPDSEEGDSKLHEYIPATKLRGSESYIAESEYYKYYRVKSDMPYTIEEELELDFPGILKVYTFDRGDVTDIPDSTKCATKVHNFLKIDGGELLAALVLRPEKNDKVLDLCSTSGNIAYCLFQTLRPGFLLCANSHGTTEALFAEHLHNYPSSWNDMLYITSEPVNETECENIFDKVLVDVPCTNDKACLFEEEDNIFRGSRVQERLTLPEVQCKWLLKGLRLVRPGGSVVYTTATLSPVQNSGVVTEALNILWQESRMEFTIKDLTPALRHTTEFFNYGSYLKLNFGTLIVPFAPVNFGPRYICKIVKKVRKEERLPAVETPFE